LDVRAYCQTEHELENKEQLKSSMPIFYGVLAEDVDVFAEAGVFDSL